MISLSPEVTDSNTSVRSRSILGFPKLPDRRSYIDVPIETILEEFPDERLGIGSPRSLLGNNPLTSGNINLPVPLNGGKDFPALSAGWNDIEGPEAQTASLGYHSITHTASKDSPKILPLSELIETSRNNPLLPDCYEFLIDSFYKWAVMTENYWLSVKTIKPNCKCVPGKSWGYTFEARPLHNRFSNLRRLRKLAKVYEIMRFEEMLGTNVFTLLTLTASHEGGWRATMDRQIFGRDRLLKLLRKYLPGIRFIWVAEPHPNKKNGKGDLGYPHFHLVIPCRVDNSIKDSQGRGLEDKLRDYWDTKWNLGSHTFGLNFEVIEDSNKVLNYILKYVGKSFTNERGWSPAELIFNANLYGAAHDEKNPVKYRTFGMCDAYNKLFPHKVREPSVTLDARLFPLSDESDLPEKNCMKGGPRPQLIPDWLGNLNLIESILKGSPDYTTRPKYDPKGKPLSYPPNHWGRPCEGLR